MRPIIVHFSNSKTKKHIIRTVKDDLFSAIATARNKRLPTRTIRPKLQVREHLTKKRAGMLRDLVRMKKDRVLQSVWTDDGVIVVRRKQGERLTRINNERDFDNFIKS